MKATIPTRLNTFIGFQELLLFVSPLTVYYALSLEQGANYILQLIPIIVTIPLITRTFHCVEIVLILAAQRLAVILLTVLVVVFFVLLKEKQQINQFQFN